MIIGYDGYDCHGNRLSPVGQAAMVVAMSRLNEALETGLSSDGDVLLSKLKRVPKMPRRKLRKLIDAHRLSPFTVEVLHFVADYRGVVVKKFIENLRTEMRRKIWDHGLRNKRGTTYSVSSIHSLIKKALVYTDR
jgi:hypothetical protein